MQKEGGDWVECVRDRKGFSRRQAFSLFAPLTLVLRKIQSAMSHRTARFAPLPLLLFVMIVLYAALVVAQAGDAGDDAPKQALIEQVVSDDAPPSGFVARTSELHDSGSVEAEAAPLPSVWTASDVVLIVLLTVVVILFGYFAGVYHRERAAKKGAFGRGPASRARIIQTSRAFAASARSHARNVQQFFSRRMPSRAGATIGRELESYLKHRQEPARPQSAKKPAQSSVSSYEDEYWQRQKEQFWSRVKRAADRIDNTPKAIQQLAVRQVQRYNEAMAQARQAKEDLYDGNLAKGAGATEAQGAGKIPELSYYPEACAPAGGMATQHQSILNQLKEAHSI